jgi:DNA polymerase-1
MIMQVHDELVFEVAIEDVPLVAHAVREHMTNAAQLKVPLLVAIGQGENWDEAQAH